MNSTTNERVRGQEKDQETSRMVLVVKRSPTFLVLGSCVFSLLTVISWAWTSPERHQALEACIILFWLGKLRASATRLIQVRNATMAFFIQFHIILNMSDMCCSTSFRSQKPFSDVLPLCLSLQHGKARHPLFTVTVNKRSWFAPF